MLSKSKQEYDFVPADAAKEMSATQEQSFLPRAGRSLWAVLAVTSGLCVVCAAALAMTASGSRSKSFLSPDIALQLQQKAQTQTLAMNNVAKGFYSGIEDKVSKAVSTPQEWEAFWGRHVANRSPRPPVPVIDFDKKIVICAFLGTKPTGGWSVDIKGVVQDSNRLRVLYEIEEPKGMVLDSLTQPFHMVTVAKTDLPLDFVKTEAVLPPLTFMVTFKDGASENKKRQVGEALKSLKGVTETITMFGGQMVTVHFDAQEIDPAAAEHLLKSMDGLSSVEKDKMLQFNS